MSKYAEFRSLGRAKCRGKKKSFDAVVDVYDELSGTIVEEPVRRNIDRDALFNLRVDLWAQEAEYVAKLDAVRDRIDEVQAMIEDSEVLE